MKQVRPNLELVNVVDVTTPRQERFSIFLRGTTGGIIPQNTYKMNHDAIGDFELFFTPIEKNEDEVIYEAVFNRLIKKQPAN